MATKSLPIKDLHSELKTKTTTDGWDVLVSYSEKQLNQFLKKTWGASDRFNNVHLELKLGHGKHAYTQVYDLKFHAPDLEFDTTHGYAYLTMPLSGSSRATDDDPKDAITIEQVKGDGSDKKPSGSLLNFDDSTQSSYYVIFHFDTQNSIWQCLANDNSDEALKNEMDQLVTEAQKWFAAHDNLQWINYSMAEVSNKSENPGNASDNLLTPSSFVFSCQPGVLNVFIHTKGGTKGEGNSTPQFGLEHDKHLTPVPTEYSASIIISRQLFLDVYMVENIKKLCPGLSSTNPVMGTSVSNGVQLELRYDKNKVIRCEDFSSWAVHMKFKSLEVDMDSHPLKLLIEDDPTDLTPRAYWKWDFSGQIHCDEVTHVLGGNSASSVDSNVSATIKERKTDFAQINGSKVNVNVKFTSADQPLVTSDHENITDVITITLNTFDVQMPQLDFFRTQNIFAPGKQVIDVQKLMVPNDLVMVGNIKGPDDV